MMWIIPRLLLFPKPPFPTWMEQVFYAKIYGIYKATLCPSWTICLLPPQHRHQEIFNRQTRRSLRALRRTLHVCCRY